MKTDVQTLIAALTCERNSIDRAITVLQQISPEPKAAAAPKVARRRVVHRQHVSATTKAMALAALASGESIAAVADAAGVSRQTVYTWRWQAAKSALATQQRVAEPVDAYATA